MHPDGLIHLYQIEYLNFKGRWRTSDLNWVIHGKIGFPSHQHAKGRIAGAGSKSCSYRVICRSYRGDKEVNYCILED